MLKKHNSPIQPSSLDNPLYYLENAKQVIFFCIDRYRDLLHSEEVVLLESFLSLAEPAQALLIRMIMRKGECFRKDQLSYIEVPDIHAALYDLEQAQLIEQTPRLSLPMLCDLCRRDECLSLVRSLFPDNPIKASTRKSDLIDFLIQQFGTTTQQTLAEWWSDTDVEVIQITCNDLFERLRLLFFGNLYQHWSEFVLTELGLQQFENVPLTTESRPFQNRQEVDVYFQLQQIQAGILANEPIDSLCQRLPEPIQSEWIEYRYQKLLFQLGREAERKQNQPLALQLYQQSQYAEAQLRWLRLQEKIAPAQELYQWTLSRLESIKKPEIRVSLQRLLSRSAKKAHIPYDTPRTVEIPEETIHLIKPGHGKVERAVIEHLSDSHTQLYHVENRLFTGLFALLFWPALFSPVRGAFFNPFQSGPADLYRPGFRKARQKLIEEAFLLLNQGDYQTIILERLKQKQGISCSLIHWPSLKIEMVESALALIPSAHLDAIFKHLLLDIRQHRRGLPDLIALNQSTQSYRLIEVKAPGDRLQDHQRLWMHALLSQNIPVTLLKVSWHS